MRVEIEPDKVFRINGKDQTLFVLREHGDATRSFTVLNVIFFPECVASSVPDGRWEGRAWHDIEKKGISYLTRKQFEDVREQRKSKYEGLNGSTPDHLKFMDEPTPSPAKQTN